MHNSSCFSTRWIACRWTTDDLWTDTTFMCYWFCAEAPNEQSILWLKFGICLSFTSCFVIFLPWRLKKLLLRNKSENLFDLARKGFVFNSSKISLCMSNNLEVTGRKMSNERRIRYVFYDSYSMLSISTSCRRKVALVDCQLEISALIFYANFKFLPPKMLWENLHYHV